MGRNTRRWHPAQSFGGDGTVLAPWQSWFGGTRTALGCSCAHPSLPRQLQESQPEMLLAFWCQDAATNPAGTALSCSIPPHRAAPDVNKVSSLQEPTFPLSHRLGTLESLESVSQIPHHLVGERRKEPSHSLTMTAGNGGCTKELVPAPMWWRMKQR